MNSLTRRFPVRQIGAFRCLKNDCTKLRHVVGSVKRSGVHFSIINGSWIIFRITRTLTIEKIKGPNFTNFTMFWLWGRVARDREIKNLKKTVKTSGVYFSIINWSLNNTIYNILCPLVFAQSAFKIKASWKLWNSGLSFFNCESTCDLTDVPALIYDRKMEARPFDTPRHSKMSQSCAISSQRPKCANLVQAGTNAYETVS